MSERSKVAIASRTVSSVARVPYVSTKAPAYGGDELSRSSASGQDEPISSGAVNGPLTCSSRLAARPSQNSRKLKPLLKTVGALHATGRSEEHTSELQSP